MYLDVLYLYMCTRHTIDIYIYIWGLVKTLVPSEPQNSW
jgi:hypothetical protein